MASTSAPNRPSVSGITFMPSVRPKDVNSAAEMNEPIMNTSPWAKLISSTMP